MDSNYIPFTGQNTTQNESAEFYCNDDVLHYDNWEWINVTPGEDYYCVAWNVAVERENYCRVDVVSDTTNKVVETGLDAEATYDGHPSWTAFISGATWIWKTFLVENPTTDETYTFKKTFAVEDVNDALLSVAADNSYEVFINGSPVTADANENNFQIGTQDNNIDVASFLTENALNNIEVRVKNWAQGGGTPQSNPAGALYRLVVNEESKDLCEQPPQDETTDVTVCKYGEQKNLLNGWVITLGAYEGTTGAEQEPGCVTFEDVPYGTYELGEEMQDGWVYVDGDLGEVEVNGENNNFQLINGEGEQCVEGPTWADSVVSSDQGTRKNGSAVLPLRTNPDNVLGEPDGDGGAGTGFFSLGVEGTITVEFDHYIENVEGDDLSFHEITNGRTTYPEELADVEVSQNGVDWEYIGTVSSKATGGVDYLDFDSTGWSWIKFVRITDVTDFGPHSADADGYDIDAIDATNGLCKEPQPECIIEGYKYDEEGQPLEGWTIGLGMWPQLEFAAGFSNGGSVVGTDETDENGYYCIVSDEDLPKNYWYEAYEIMQDGWTDIGYEIEGGEMQDLYPGSDSFDDHFFTNNINEYLFGDNVLPIQIDFYNTGELSCDPDVNFIQNGGFETPSVTLAQGWELFAGGGPLVWLVDWMTGGAGNIELHAGVNGWLPYEGEQYAELDTHGNAPGSNIKIYQNLVTEDDEEYALSFAFSPRPGTSAADNEFEVWWNGILLDTISADGSANSNTDWEVHTYNGLDGDESSTLEFRAIGTQNTLGTFLDDIALYCVPKSGGGDDKKGSITIIKQDVSDTDEEFEFTSDLGNFTLGDGDSKLFSDLDGDEYLITEVIPSGWSDPVISCDDDDSGLGQGSGQLLVILDDEEHVTCTFTNRLPNGDNDISTTSGGGGSSRRISSSSSSDEGEVLGEQTSILPIGAPATGNGGLKMCIQ